MTRFTLSIDHGFRMKKGREKDRPVGNWGPIIMLAAMSMSVYWHHPGSKLNLTACL